MIAVSDSECKVEAFNFTPTLGGPYTNAALTYLLSTYLFFPNIMKKIRKRAEKGSFMVDRINF